MMAMSYRVYGLELLNTFHGNQLSPLFGFCVLGQCHCATAFHGLLHLISGRFLKVLPLFLFANC
jgi:hypothetical protein